MKFMFQKYPAAAYASVVGKTVMDAMGSGAD
jgi:hypothetical protein